MITYIIRFALTAGLVFMVYKETGFWTAFSIALITLSLELIIFASKKYLDTLEAIVDLLGKEK